MVTRHLAGGFGRHANNHKSFSSCPSSSPPQTDVTPSIHTGVFHRAVLWALCCLLCVFSPLQSALDNPNIAPPNLDNYSVISWARNPVVSLPEKSNSQILNQMKSFWKLWEWASWNALIRFIHWTTKLWSTALKVILNFGKLPVSVVDREFLKRWTQKWMNLCVDLNHKVKSQ